MNYEKNHEEFVARIFGVFLEKHEIADLSLEKRQIIEYTYISNMVNALITYGHGGKIYTRNFLIIKRIHILGSENRKDRREKSVWE